MKTVPPTMFRQARSPQAGNVIEPVITYEELPIVTEAARIDLLESLQRGEEDLKAGHGKAMNADEMKSELRASFEKITGFKIVRSWSSHSIDSRSLKKTIRTTSNI